MEPDPASAAVKTYNYLRIALAALVLLLFVSVALGTFMLWKRQGSG